MAKKGFNLVLHRNLSLDFPFAVLSVLFRLNQKYVVLTNNLSHFRSYIIEMNKLILSGAFLLVIVLLLPTSTTAAKKSGAFLDELCSKCKYCKTDPDCTGCKKCSECENRKQEGCRFCRIDEVEKECVERCSKGCRICGGKDGTGLESCKKRDNEENVEK